MVALDVVDLLVLMLLSGATDWKQSFETRKIFVGYNPASQNHGIFLLKTKFLS